MAASAFGAGFGGAVWAMVNREQAESFREAWSRAYHKSFPQQANDAAFITTSPGPPATRLG